jgi:hypothetical protein
MKEHHDSSYPHVAVCVWGANRSSPYSRENVIVRVTHPFVPL